jgi:hypothetical protein
MLGPVDGETEGTGIHGQQTSRGTEAGLADQSRAGPSRVLSDKQGGGFRSISNDTGDSNDAADLARKRGRWARGPAGAVGTSAALGVSPVLRRVRACAYVDVVHCQGPQVGRLSHCGATMSGAAFVPSAFMIQMSPWSAFAPARA